MLRENCWAIQVLYPCPRLLSESACVLFTVLDSAVTQLAAAVTTREPDGCEGI